jgi:lipopolysaccharide heptosyltransferase II
MRILRVKMHDWARNVLMVVDYLLYVLLNPFKFKSVPKIVNRILVVELLSVGDLLVITPALRALKERFRNAQINVLVRPGMEQVLSGNKNIDKIVTIDEEFFQLVRTIKSEQYDLGIIFHPGSLRMSLALLLGKVKYRLGCTTDVGLTYGKGFFLNKQVKPYLKWQHKVNDNLLVVHTVGAQTKNKSIEVHTTKKAREQINKLMGRKKFIVFHPGSKYKTQMWYSERFAQVADSLVERYKTPIVFSGTPDQEGVVKEIMKRMKKKAVSMVGKTNFEEYVALIEQSSMLVSVDTSAVHIASAFKKQVVALFGPTLPERWGPSETKSVAIQNNDVCTGCRSYRCLIRTHECMRSITPEQVVRAVEKIRK